MERISESLTGAEDGIEALKYWWLLARVLVGRDVQELKVIVEGETSRN